MSHPAGLPEPDAAARAHSARLAKTITDAIAAAGGALPFDRFMELALYAPGLGYYSAGAARFGAAGDFVTAPEVSALFGRCVAAQAAELLQRLGGGELLELGAGRGALAVDLLLELERLGALPDRYRILEVSAALREEQRLRIAAQAPHLAAHVAWLERWPEPGFRGLVLANEVVDAQPVSRFRWRDGRVEEAVVVADTPAGFAPGWRPAPPALAARVAALHAAAGPWPDGYESEVNLRLPDWIAALGERLDAGALLLVDYGYPRREYYHPQRTGGTLLCHYRHRAHPDPLRLVGLQDITAQVDFTALAEAADAAGLAVAGYTSQAHFLIGCGIEERAGLDSTDDLARLRVAHEVRTLLLPGEMGERFQALLLTRGLAPPFRGFSGRDLRGRL